MSDDAPLFLILFVLIISLIVMGWQAHHFKMKFWDVFWGATPVVVINKNKKEELE